MAIDVRGVCTLVLVFDMPTSLKHSDVCLYFGCPDVDGAYCYLRSKGVDVKEPKVAHYGMKQLCLLDPDGYNLCFQWEATPAEQPVP